ncbi:hypothetical protein Q31b_25790 [Novipirellula aureliae]|uniref:Uncharacterized protein n=1 Tax=Novipirellula aureliae TaxID=2527966 RepID=A0A5C6E3S2_9BACT|nr:hypothetical protein [Novipirellula aureliae]TWU43538.1 hypothetical protein Q31b_25790 [Novipirellula aureliae]
MTEPIFDHDRLDVYRLSIEYVASSFTIAKDLNGFHRHARDLNAIAKGSKCCIGSRQC